MFQSAVKTLRVCSQSTRRELVMWSIKSRQDWYDLQILFHNILYIICIADYSRFIINCLFLICYTIPSPYFRIHQPIINIQIQVLPSAMLFSHLVDYLILL